MSTIKLTVKDRIVMGEVLPEQGGMLDMILAKSISDKTTLTAREITLFGVEQEGTTLKWDQEKDTGVEMPFEVAEVDLLKRRLKELDESKSINSRIFDLCLKIREL